MVLQFHKLKNIYCSTGLSAERFIAEIKIHFAQCITFKPSLWKLQWLHVNWFPLFSFTVGLSIPKVAAELDMDILSKSGQQCQWKIGSLNRVYYSIYRSTWCQLADHFSYNIVYWLNLLNLLKANCAQCSQTSKLPICHVLVMIAESGYWSDLHRNSSTVGKAKFAKYIHLAHYSLPPNFIS